MKNLLKVSVILSFVCLCLAADRAEAIVIDDFTAGDDFTTSNSVETYVGPGPIGGTRHVAVAPTQGSNTTTLDTNAGTLSIAMTGNADTTLTWGSMDPVNGSELDLAVDGAESFRIVFDSFSRVGTDDVVAFLRYRGSDSSSFYQMVATPTQINTLDANNGGALEFGPLSSFFNFGAGGAYDGEVDGINFAFDDSDFTATISRIEITGAPVPEPSSIALAGLGLIGLTGYGIRRRRKC